MFPPEISIQKILRNNGGKAPPSPEFYYHEPYPLNVYRRVGKGGAIRYYFSKILRDIGVTKGFKIRPESWALQIYDFWKPVEFGFYGDGIKISVPESDNLPFSIKSYREVRGVLKDLEPIKRRNRLIFYSTAKDEIIEILQKIPVAPESNNQTIGCRLRYIP